MSNTEVDNNAVLERFLVLTAILGGSGEQAAVHTRCGPHAVVRTLWSAHMETVSTGLPSKGCLMEPVTTNLGS